MTEVDPSRSCGTCTACCGTGITITEVNKPEGEVCVNLKDGGCSIYSTRPEVCREFYCMWRWGMGRLMERPDKVGFFFDLTTADNKKIQILVAHEAWPGAFDSTEVKERLSRLAKKQPIFRVRHDERKLLGPKELVEAMVRNVKK